MGSVPGLALDYDINWVVIKPDAQPGPWAQAAARELLQREGVVDDDAVKASLPERLETVATATLNEAMIRGFVMCPPVDLQIRCVVRLVTIELDDGLSDEVARETVVRALTPAPDVTAGETRRDQLTSPAGAVTRLVTRTAQGDERNVIEDLYYIWVFPAMAGSAVLLTSFYDLTEAGRWRPVVDKLATGLEIES